MNRITEIMISAIRAQACGGEGASFGEITDEELRSLYALSKAQDMAHIVAAELDKQGMLKNGDEISEKFRKQMLMAVFRYERINYDLEDISRALDKKEIPHIVLKGSTIRRYYPEPWMRTSSDIDIYADNCNIEAIKNVLCADLKAEYKGVWNSEHSFFTASGVHIEIHDDLNQDSEKQMDCLNDIWSHSVKREGFEYSFEMTDEMFYFYHIAHMVKHFKSNGCGARFFLDMWILRHRVEYDGAKREALLENSGLLGFTRAAEHLSDVWFSGAERDDMTDTLEEYIFSGGIYGSRENHVITAQIRKGGKFGYAMSRIFLPYSQMTSYFPIVKKHKWLYPFSHIARWVRIIFRRDGVKNSVKDLKHSASVDEAQKNGVEDMLRELGLR